MYRPGITIFSLAFELKLNETNGAVQSSELQALCKLRQNSTATVTDGLHFQDFHHDDNS